LVTCQIAAALGCATAPFFRSVSRVSCASRPLDPARPAPTPLPTPRCLAAYARLRRQGQRAQAGRVVRNRQAWRAIRTVPRPGGGPTRPPRRTLLPVCPDRRACGRESAVVKRRKSARRCAKGRRYCAPARWGFRSHQYRLSQRPDAHQKEPFTVFTTCPSRVPSGRARCSTCGAARSVVAVTESRPFRSRRPGPGWP
jgi:hypothetical protein